MKAISLFSGAGGMDLGFERAGFDVVVAVEKDKACCETLRRNRPRTKIIQADISTVQTRTILEEGSLAVGEAAVVFGGPPCQPFSLAGERKGLGDSRGNLVMEFIRIVREALPVSFVMENVVGLANWGGGSALRMFLREFCKPINNGPKEESYCVAWAKLDAVCYGVPQHRERLIIVGNRLGKDFWFPRGTDERLTVRQSICGLPPADAPSEVAERVSKSIQGRIEKHGF